MQALLYKREYKAHGWRQQGYRPQQKYNLSRRCLGPTRKFEVTRVLGSTSRRQSMEGPRPVKIASLLPKVSGPRTYICTKGNIKHTDEPQTTMR